MSQNDLSLFLSGGEKHQEKLMHTKLVFAILLRGLETIELEFEKIHSFVSYFSLSLEIL